MREELFQELGNTAERFGALEVRASAANDDAALAATLLVHRALRRVEKYLRAQAPQLQLPGAEDSQNNNKQEAKAPGKRRGRKPKPKEETQPTLGLSTTTTTQEPTKETAADKPDKKNGGAKLRAVPSTQAAPEPADAS